MPAYDPTYDTWYDLPSTLTPITAAALQAMDDALLEASNIVNAFFPRFRPGQLYTSPQVGGQSISEITMTDGQQVWIPFPVPYATSLTAISYYQKSAGSSAEVVRLALYNDDGYGSPSTVKFDAGTLSASAGTNVRKDIAIDQDLDPAFYWLSMAAQGGGTGPNVTCVFYPWPAPMGTNSEVVMTNCVGYTKASVSGAFATVAFADLTKTNAKLPACYVTPV